MTLGMESSSSPSDSSLSPAQAPASSEAPAPEAASGGEASHQTGDSAPAAKPEAELTIAEKLQRKYEANQAKASQRGADGKFQSKGPQGGSNANAPAGMTNVAKPGDKPVYVPNFKYKVLDKEHEIPEAFRGIIKDPDTEKMVKELHEKATGLDIVKPKLKEVRQERDQLASENYAIKREVQELRTMYQKDDLDGFFGKLKIPEEKILQWLAGKIRMKQQLAGMSPEQRAMFERTQSDSQRAQELEARLQAMQAEANESRSTAMDLQLQTALSKPEVKTFAEAFDARKGAGSFMNEVIDYGEWKSMQSGKDISPEQAIQEVMARYGTFLTPAQQAAAPQGQPAAPVEAAPAAQPAPQRQAPPVIPAVTGRSNTPVKNKPKSIEDLKKLGQSFGR
jgi:hypothetical protein